MNKLLTIFLSIQLLPLMVVSQYNREFSLVGHERTCYKLLTLNSSTSHKQVYCIDTCNDASFKIDLLQLDTNKFYRDGMSVYYYDKSSTTIKAMIPFTKSNINGFVKTFYSNGKLRYEGLCRTVKYIQPSGGNFIYKIDNNDTTVIAYNGVSTYDSIKNINMYCFMDDITGEPNNNDAKDLLFYSPYYQKQKFGEWNYYNEKGKIVMKEVYEEGKLKSREKNK
jgi:antitoxin component YwqK of YwqJK toxin-antitoxin module